MNSSTQTLIEALRILARDIESGDGIANACIAEAADRLEGYAERLAELESQKAFWEQAFNEMKHQRDEVVAKRDDEIAEAQWAAS